MEVLAWKAVQEKDGSIKLETEWQVWAGRGEQENRLEIMQPPEVGSRVQDLAGSWAELSSTRCEPQGCPFRPLSLLDFFLFIAKTAKLEKKNPVQSRSTETVRRATEESARTVGEGSWMGVDV